MVLEIVLMTLVLGWLLRGKFGRLADVNISYYWMIFVPVGLYVGSLIAGAAHFVPHNSWVFGMAHLVGFIAFVVVAIANRHIPGVYLMCAGLALNVIAIVANGGVMPGSREAIISIGAGESLKHVGTAMRHSLIGSDTHLSFLCDIIAFKRPFVIWPSVYSIGDIITSLGGLIAIVAIMRSPRYSKQAVLKET